MRLFAVGNRIDFNELRGYVVSKNAEGDKETDGSPVFGASSEEETETEKAEPVATLASGKLHLPGRTTVVLRSSEHYDDVVIDPNSFTSVPEDEKVQTIDQS